jgi:hypothetical protein
MSPVLVPACGNPFTWGWVGSHCAFDSGSYEFMLCCIQTRKVLLVHFGRFLTSPSTRTCTDPCTIYHVMHDLAANWIRIQLFI